MTWPIPTVGPRPLGLLGRLYGSMAPSLLLRNGHHLKIDASPRHDEPSHRRRARCGGCATATGSTGSRARVREIYAAKDRRAHTWRERDVSTWLLEACSIKVDTPAEVGHREVIMRSSISIAGPSPARAAGEHERTNYHGN